MKHIHINIIQHSDIIQRKENESNPDPSKTINLANIY